MIVHCEKRCKFKSNTKKKQLWSSNFVFQLSFALIFLVKFQLRCCANRLLFFADKLHLHYIIWQDIDLHYQAI